MTKDEFESIFRAAMEKAFGKQEKQMSEYQEALNMEEQANTVEDDTEEQENTDRDDMKKTCDDMMVEIQEKRRVEAEEQSNTGEVPPRAQRWSTPHDDTNFGVKDLMVLKQSNTGGVPPRAQRRGTPQDDTSSRQKWTPPVTPLVVGTLMVKHGIFRNSLGSFLRTGYAVYSHQYRIKFSQYREMWENINSCSRLEYDTVLV